MFQVRSIQAAVKEQLFPKKNPCRELEPICQVLLASKLGKGEVVLDLQNLSCLMVHVPVHKVIMPFPACIAIIFCGHYLSW